MGDDNSFEVAEAESSVYNIRHRAFYFSSDVVLFVGVQKYERI